MAIVVVDASAFIRFLSGAELGWEPAPADEMHAPEVCDLEVMGAIRSALLLGRLPSERAEEMLVDYVSLPIRRHAYRALLSRCWELRHNMSVADAGYVALSERLGAALVTVDARLAQAVSRHTSVPVLP